MKNMNVTVPAGTEKVTLSVPNTTNKLTLRSILPFITTRVCVRVIEHSGAFAYGTREVENGQALKDLVGSGDWGSWMLDEVPTSIEVEDGIRVCSNCTPPANTLYSVLVIYITNKYVG